MFTQVYIRLLTVVNILAFGQNIRVCGFLSRRREGKLLNPEKTAVLVEKRALII
jgi:hypothetical protein